MATFTNKFKAVKYISKLCSKTKTFQLNMVLEHKRNGTNTIRISDIFIIKSLKTGILDFRLKWGTEKCEFGV